MKRTSFLEFLPGSLLLCSFDPQATGVLANWHIIDQVGCDLQLRRTIYESYHLEPETRDRG
ncbi:MAG: hypothetical protein ABSG14_05770 [Verrucomicrobiia bacterium]|jgi:hypothetical protein